MLVLVLGYVFQMPKLSRSAPSSEKMERERELNYQLIKRDNKKFFASKKSLRSPSFSLFVLGAAFYLHATQAQIHSWMREDGETLWGRRLMAKYIRGQLREVIITTATWNLTKNPIYWRIQPCLRNGRRPWHIYIGFNLAEATGPSRPRKLATAPVLK